MSVFRSDDDVLGDDAVLAFLHPFVDRSLGHIYLDFDVFAIFDHVHLTTGDGKHRVALKITFFEGLNNDLNFTAATKGRHVAFAHVLKYLKVPGSHRRLWTGYATEDKTDHGKSGGDEEDGGV